MGSTGRKRRLHKAVHELFLLSAEFKDAMHQANPTYIAERGEFTPRMQDIWNRYREWSKTYEKDFI